MLNTNDRVLSDYKPMVFNASRLELAPSTAQLILPQDNDGTTPTLTFGDGCE